MVGRRASGLEKPESELVDSGAVDIHIGARLRKLRSMLGMSQDQLGRSLGLTFQQIQKYEHGTNRIAASRLFQIAKILNVPIAYFFEEMEIASSSAPKPKGFSEAGQAALEVVAGAEAPEHREALEFWRVYNRIDNVKQRRKMYELMRSITED